MGHIWAPLLTFNYLTPAHSRRRRTRISILDAANRGCHVLLMLIAGIAQVYNEEYEGQMSPCHGLTWNMALL